MKLSSHFQCFAWVWGLALLLSGCIFKPVTVSTRRFVLELVPAAEHASATAEQLPVGIGFVKMPPYLMRSSMAVRKGSNEIEYLEDALWAERLDQCFQRTLAANLSALLPSDRVYLSSWERDQVTVSLFVNVEQFDVDTQGQGTLIAWWRMTAPGRDRPLKSGQARLARTGPAPRGHPQVIAATLSALTAEFSRDLAQAMHRFASQAGHHE